MSTISYRHHDHPQAGQIAAALAATGFVALAVFQLALAFGAPLGHAAWGGAAANLTSGQRTGSAVSVYLLGPAALVLAFLCFIVRPEPNGIAPTQRSRHWAGPVSSLASDAPSGAPGGLNSSARRPSQARSSRRSRS